MSSNGSLSRHYEVQEKVFGYDPKFVVVNEDDKRDFMVKSIPFTVGDRLSMVDACDNELFQIRQRLLSFVLTLNILAADGTEVALVQRQGMPWNYKLEVTSPIFGDYRMDWLSGFLNQEFLLKKDNKIVAKIHRKWAVLAHIYSVEIEDDVTDGEIPFVLSLVIALWCAQRYRGQFMPIK